MGEVINIFKNKEQSVDDSIDTRKLTPDLVRQYKDTILLVSQYQDQLEKEDWVHAYGMVLSWNSLIMQELEKLNGEVKEKA